jgi:hypothetical protein
MESSRGRDAPWSDVFPSNIALLCESTSRQLRIGPVRVVFQRIYPRPLSSHKCGIIYLTQNPRMLLNLRPALLAAAFFYLLHGFRKRGFLRSIFLFWPEIYPHHTIGEAGIDHRIWFNFHIDESSPDML